MRARFLAEQPSVRIAVFDGVVAARVCVNGRMMVDMFDTPDGDGRTVTYWEYDYNEFSADLAEIDVTELAARPEEYIDF